MSELHGIPGFHNISREEAKMLIQPVIGADGHYLLRPTDDQRAICTICVSIRQKLMNYKLMQEPTTRLFYLKDLKFPTISALIHHYSQYPINPEVQTFLRYPVIGDQGDEYVALEPPPTSSISRDGPRIANTLPKNFGGGGAPSGGPPALPERPRPKMRAPLPEPPQQTDPRNRTMPPPTRRDSTPETSNNKLEVIETLPGVHVNLPKNFVQVILNFYSKRDSSYLVRPSVSSKGQFTISLTVGNSVLNFKINRDPSDGQYFVTPRKKFSSVRELLETHRTVPLKSKARPGAKIYLLHPITTEEVQTVMNMYNPQQKQDNQPSLTPGTSAPLPPPWKEYFDKNHQRPYYYNPQTKQTVWEKPKPKNMKKANTIDGRSSRPPLPGVPEERFGKQRDSQGNSIPEERPMNKQRGSLDSQMAQMAQMSQRGAKIPNSQRNLPELPPKNPTPTPQRFGGLSNGEMSPKKVPQLPPKEINNPPAYNSLEQPLSRGPISKSPNFPAKNPGLPPLPPKDSSTLPPLPEKVPPLPKKEPTLPALPPKEPPVSSQTDVPIFPPLPPKDPSSTAGGNPAPSLPPLPPKEPSSAPSPSSSRLRPTEYEDTIFPSPNTAHKVVNAPLPPPLLNLSPGNIPPAPPIPQVEVMGPPAPPPMGSGPPPPPPIPANGIPGPPPPPPMSPSPVPKSQTKQPRPTSTPAPEPSGGRPFSANDLLQQRNRLKTKTSEEFEPRAKTGSFLENTLSSAIESRLGSIRNAMDDSDSDTDVEEVDDDDDWD